jgi:hypothetical protein
LVLRLGRIDICTRCLHPSTSLKNRRVLKGNGNKHFYCLIWKDVIYKILLQIFHILLHAWNSLTESNELSAILDYWGYAYYVTSGVTLVFYRASDEYEPETRVLVAISMQLMVSPVFQEGWLLFSVRTKCPTNGPFPL